MYLLEYIYIKRDKSIITARSILDMKIIKVILIKVCPNVFIYYSEEGYELYIQKRFMHHANT